MCLVCVSARISSARSLNFWMSCSNVASGWFASAYAASVASLSRSQTYPYESSQPPTKRAASSTTRLAPSSTATTRASVSFSSAAMTSKNEPVSRLWGFSSTSSLSSSSDASSTGPRRSTALVAATSARQVSCRTARMSATAGLSSTCLSPRRIAATPNKGAVSFVFGSPCSARDNDRKLVLTALRSASSISESTCFRRLSHSRRTSGESRAKMARNVFFSTFSISARRSPNVFAASASRVSCACWNSPSWYTRFLVSDTRLSSLIAAHFSRTASMHSLNASTCALTSPTCFRLSVM